MSFASPDICTGKFAERASQHKASFLKRVILMSGYIVMNANIEFNDKCIIFDFIKKILDHLYPFENIMH